MKSYTAVISREWLLRHPEAMAACNRADKGTKPLCKETAREKRDRAKRYLKSLEKPDSEELANYPERE